MIEFNTPERVMQIRKLMEARFGMDVTKRSLSRTLNEEAFKECYKDDDADE